MKKKIIIPAFALLIGAALAGSITSTAAWYQYSTKTNAALIGASGGAAGNLNMRIREDGQGANEGWTTFLSKERLSTYLATAGYGQNIRPVTPGALDKDDELSLDTNDVPKMYANPIPGKGPYAQWKPADKVNFIVIPLQLRFVERDGVIENGVDEKNVEREVYLSDLVLEQRTESGVSDLSGEKDTSDISAALRFHISSYNNGTPNNRTNRLISKNGGTTVTNGQLDLDGDGNPDTPRASDKYGFSDTSAPSGSPLTYGAGQQVSYTAEKLAAPATGRKYYSNQNALVSESDPVYSLVPQSRDGKDGDDLVDNTLIYDPADDTTSKAIGTTIAATSNFLNVDITIWVEGWQKFETVKDEGTYSSIWNKSYIGSDFNIGFEFAVNAETDA